MNRVGSTVAQEDCCCNVAITSLTPIGQFSMSIPCRTIASLTISAVSSNRVSPRYDFDPKTEFRELIGKDARLTEP